MRIVALLVVLVCGEAGAETLYTRSAAICPNNGNGTAYGCAASAGGAGAWNTSAVANVIWGSGAAKVSAGDTLYLCGTLTDFAVVAGISGTTGNQIVISTACPGDAGSISGGAGNNFSIDITNKSYITVQDSDIRWAKRNALFVGVSDAAGANQTDIYVLRNRANNVGATTTTNVCHTIYFNAITGPSALYRINNAKVIDNEVTGTETVCANSNNDGINLENLGTGGIVTDNDVTGSHEGLDISAGTGLVLERNHTHANTHAGIKLHGIMNCMTGTRANANITADNGQWGFIWQDQVNGFLTNTNIKHAGALHGLDIESVNTWGGTCVTGGNTYANNYISGDYASGAARIYNTTKAAFEAANTWNGNVLRQVGSNTTLIYWTSDTGNNITQANFAANWLPAHLKDQQQVVPDWAGGPNPTSLQGYRLKPTSPFICTGINVGRITDALGRPHEPNCTPIGAMVYGRGDARATALPARP